MPKLFLAYNQILIFLAVSKISKKKKKKELGYGQS